MRFTGIISYDILKMRNKSNIYLILIEGEVI